MLLRLVFNFLFVLGTFLIPQVVHAEAKSQPEAVALLARMSRALMALQRVSYHSHRELNYATENYHNELEGDVYLEFDDTPPLGVRFQLHLSKGFEVFNGSEMLHGNAATHTMEMRAVKSEEEVSKSSFLYNSMYTLRRALPGLIADASIEKTLVSKDRQSYVLQVRIAHAQINPTGALEPITLPWDILYRITMNRKNSLPVEVLRTNNQNADFTRVRFTKVEPRVPKVAENSWFYTSYVQEYPLAVPADREKVLAAGTDAPAWSLPATSGEAKSVTLDEVLKESSTKLVLLEFWISHCGYSIDAVPKLNALSGRFASQGLKVLAINADDSEATIQAFVKKNGPRYPLLSSGGPVAEKYGVGGYPTVFLVNPSGKIVYSTGGLEEAALTERIRSFLSDASGA